MTNTWFFVAAVYAKRPRMARAMNALRLSSFSWLLATIGCAPVVEPIPPAPETTPTKETRRYNARDFYATVQLAGLSFSHDGSRLLYTSDATGIFQSLQSIGG